MFNSNEEMMELTEGHPKNPRGKFWEGNTARLYRGILKRQRRRARNLKLAAGGAFR